MHGPTHIKPNSSVVLRSRSVASSAIYSEWYRYNICYDIVISGRKLVCCLNNKLDKNILLCNCICFHVLSSSKTCSCALFTTLTLLRIMTVLVQNVFVKRRISCFEFLFQINPVHIITPYGLVIHLNIVFPTTPQSEKWLFPYFLICTC